MANTNETRGQEPRPKKRKKRGGAGAVALTVAKVLGTLVLVGAITGAILASFAAVYIRNYIVPKAFLDIGDFSLDLSTTLYYTDASGVRQELRTIHGSSNRVLIAYEDLPQDLIDATICTEDKRFREHKGVDWIRTARSALDMFTGKSTQGGSTITQQLIKNLTQNDEVTVQRKILEIFTALEFEKNHSKNNILEMYLNYIYLGAGSDGVYTAAQNYFNKEVSELSLAECATLISITNNPSIYGPYVSQRGEDGTTDFSWGRKSNAERTKDTILLNMLKQEKITQAEYDQACAEIDAGLNFVRAEGETHDESPYTWYEDQVIEDVIRDLQERLGYSKKVAEDMVYHSGLKIETCLNKEYQAIVDEVYENPENLPYTSGSGQQLQSGIVIVNPAGDVVALSGGIGEKDRSRLFSCATARRAPGSAFKPLSVYAPALDLGLITPASVLDDTPYQINDNGKGYPGNSYLRYVGRMNIRDAITVSSNAVAIRELTQLTPEASFDFLTTKLGLKLERGRMVNDQLKTDIALAPLSMGGLTDGVSAMDMAAAYATFPRGGTYVPPRTYTRVYDNEDKILLDNTTDRSPIQAIKPTTAWYINSMLKDVVSYKTVQGIYATGADAIFDNMAIAGKTGSTDANMDRWFVGYTPYYTAAVWTGYNQPERIHANGNPAAHLWKQVMSRIHEGMEYRDFDLPAGAGELSKVLVCADSGVRATDGCANDPRGSRGRYESFFPGDAPTAYCTVHAAPIEICKDSAVVNEDGSTSGAYHLAGEFCPEESRATLAYMDLDLERDAATGKFARDNGYTKAYVEAQGTCTVHTTAPEPVPYDPSIFDITNPETWPTPEQWPGFDPTWPETWPTVPVTPPPGMPNETEPPVDPGEGEPVLPPEPSVEPTGEPEVDPLPTPEVDEPFLPVA